MRCRTQSKKGKGILTVALMGHSLCRRSGKDRTFGIRLEMGERKTFGQ